MRTLIDEVLKNLSLKMRVRCCIQDIDCVALLRLKMIRCESDKALIEDVDHQQEDDRVLPLAEEEVEEVDPQDCCCYTQDQAVARAAVYVRSLDDNDD